MCGRQSCCILSSLATLLTHGMIGSALAAAGRHTWRDDWRYWTAAILCSGLPDADVLGFNFGIHYGDLWGHRGLTHSLLVAALLAVSVSVVFLNSRSHCFELGLMLFLITASHGVLDAFTNGGFGVAFFSPFNPSRYFFPWRPIRVSPIGVRFFSHRGWLVLRSEFVWVWIPTAVVFALIWAFRSRQNSVKFTSAAS